MRPRLGTESLDFSDFPESPLSAEAATLCLPPPQPPLTHLAILGATASEDDAYYLRTPCQGISLSLGPSLDPREQGPRNTCSCKIASSPAVSGPGKHVWD